jgi:hypothetical protein
VLKHRGGHDSKIDHVMAAGNQAGENAFPQHHSARAGIAPHQNGPSRLYERAEGTCEIDNVTRRESGSDNTAQSNLGNSKCLVAKHVTS